MKKRLIKVAMVATLLFGGLAAAGSALAFYSETQYLGFDIVENNWYKFFYITAKPAMLEKYSLAYCEKRYDGGIVVWFQKKDDQARIQGLDGSKQHTSIYYRAIMNSFTANEYVLHVQVLEDTLKNARNPRCTKDSDSKVTITLDKF